MIESVSVAIESGIVAVATETFFLEIEIFSSWLETWTLTSERGGNEEEEGRGRRWAWVAQESLVSWETMTPDCTWLGREGGNGSYIANYL